MRVDALLGFAPFAAFALIEKLVGIVPGLATGLVVSLALVAWEAVRHRSANLLEIGSAILFGGLTAWALHHPQNWSVWAVRLYVDAGLAVSVFVSMLLRRPFTMQHGSKSVSPEIARGSTFLRHNMVLSGVWGLAFAGLALVDLVMTLIPARDRLGIILTLAILITAARFTFSYVKRIPGSAWPGADAPQGRPPDR